MYPTNICINVILCFVIQLPKKKKSVRSYDSVDDFVSKKSAEANRT